MLWLYFIILAVIIFVMLWFMQVVFLQTYYSTMKKAETAQLGTEVESAFVSALDYKDQIDNMAYSFRLLQHLYFQYGRRTILY